MLDKIEKFFDVPDGSYSTKIRRADIRESDTGVYVAWEFRIISGEYEGHIIARTDRLDNPHGAIRFKSVCRAMGENIYRAKDIPNVINRLVSSGNSIRISIAAGGLRTRILSFKREDTPQPIKGRIVELSVSARMTAKHSIGVVKNFPLNVMR